jgi:hypothetical protein
MKVLVITYDFFPDNTPNTYRWLNILNEWNKRDINIFVISNQKNNFEKSEIHNNIKIFRTKEFLLGYFKNNLSKPEIISTKSRHNFNNLLRKFLKYFYKKTWSNLYWPDFAVLWTFSTYRMAKKIIKDEKIDKIITISWPFSSHLIGYFLKKNNRNIEWLAETIDPFNFFSGVNNQILYYNLNRYAERKFFNYADHLTVTTDNIRNRYIFLYPEIENKIHVIKNLYVPIIYNKTFAFERDNKPLKMSFFGSLIINVRTPDLVIQFFELITSNEKFQDIELHFYGTYNELLKNFDKVKENIGKNIFLHGLISKKQVEQEIDDSDILINIGNKNEFQEPSKIFEYMYFQKPIITFTEILNDTSIQILKNYPKLFEVTKNTVNAKSLIDDFDNFVKNIDIHINEYQLSKILEPHLIETIEEEYFKILFK